MCIYVCARVHTYMEQLKIYASPASNFTIHALVPEAFGSVRWDANHLFRTKFWAWPCRMSWF